MAKKKKVSAKGKSKKRRDALHVRDEEYVTVVQGLEMEVDDESDELNIAYVDAAMSKDGEKLKVEGGSLTIDLEEGNIENAKYVSWEFIEPREKKKFQKDLDDEKAEEFWTILNALGCECDAEARRCNHIKSEVKHNMEEKGDIKSSMTDAFSKPMFFDKERHSETGFKPPIEIRTLDSEGQVVSHAMDTPPSKNKCNIKTIFH